MSNLLDKIGALKTWLVGNGGDNQDVHLLGSWEEEAKRLFLLKSLKDHDGIKYVLDIFVGEVKKINEQLLNKRQMFEDERYRLLDQRELLKKYIDLFQIEDDLARLEEAVDRESAIIK